MDEECEMTCFVIGRERLALRRSQYTRGGVALDLVDGDGEVFMRLTVCLPETASLAEGEFAVKVWSENEPFIDEVLASGVFEDTGKRIPTGFVEAHVWRFRCESCGN